MRPESDWTQRAFELFDEAVELPPEEWEARVARLSNGDTRLAAEVMGLLDAHLRDGGLLDRPLPSTWPSLGD
ncbi:MAG: hypothetical protein HKN73_06355, partial [Gemmatimonadetes bacterium]|nr:hypothetical protein [Gemmatimonadota bacterium]